MEENLSGALGGGYGGNYATDDKVAMVDSGGDERTESREEGELCSDSDEDYRETGSASQFVNCNAATQLESVQDAPLNKMTQDVKFEICNAVNKSSSMVDLSSSAYPQLDPHKDSEKNRGEFVPFVIRFSDDESGSDSDNSSRSNTLESKDNTQGTDESKRPPSHSLQKSRKPHKSIVKEASVMPKQISVGCPGVSSKSKTSGALKNAGPVPSNQSLNDQKIGSGKDHQSKTNLDVNTAKMQDLRQKIEIRENQIKRKTAQQTKSSYTGFQRENNARNSNNSASSPDKTAQVHDLPSKLNSPDKKRLKTGEPQFRKLRLDCHNSVGDTLLLEKSTLNDQGKLNIEGSCYSGKDNIQKTSHASHLEEQKQNTRLSQHTSANFLFEKEGPRLDANSLLENMNDGIADNIFSPAQIGQTGQGLTGDFPTKLAPSNNANFLNFLDKLRMNKHNKLDTESMLHYEDILDKELEAAQEHRRKCEIDEWNALTAYRKAQRALVEANARCSNLYSQRELYSAQLRSLMMENPNQFFSSKPPDQTEAGLSVSNMISDVDAHLIPTSSNCKKAPADISGRRALHAKITPPGSAFQNQSHLHVEGQNLVSDPYGEPDRSSLEAHRPGYVSNGVCCSSDDLNQSADEDDVICQLKPTSVQDNLESAQTSECDGGRDKDNNHGLQGQLSVDSPQDSLLLEASLRSQLYKKLRAKKMFKRGVSENAESANERLGDDDDGGKMIGAIENAPIFEVEIDKRSDLESASKEQGISELPVRISSHTDLIPSDHASPSVGDPINHHFLPEGPELTILSISLCPTIRSTFIHLKSTEPVATLQPETTSSDILSPDINEKCGVKDICPENQTIMLSEDMPEMATLNLFNGKSGYYSCNPAIDPLWPLCMFELRGKCNNDECSWQHVKDYNCDSMQRDTIDNIDCQVQKELQREGFSKTLNFPKSLDHLALVPPTYVVSSDLLRPNSQSHTSLLAEDYGKCWQTCFSNFLVLSSLFQKALRSNEPFLHGTEARIEVQSEWNRQSSYFHSRNSRLVDQSSDVIDQSLEMALLNFSKEANKQKGRVEALKVLVPAIEANSRSTVLWMVYLQIFYFNQKSIGKDDIFKLAVKFNLESYELWLMYINSREHIEDRLAAYDAALSALSHHVSAANCDASCASQCILDIFLQMLDFMCRSGNVGNAIEKISELVSTKKTDEPCEPTLYDVISCLTNCDKFIFWISCVYIIVYKKLPDPVVHSFECWKESSPIEWPDVNLTCDQKQQAASLMEMAVDSLVSYIDSGSLENEKTLRAAYLFALNHVRCVSVLEGLACSRLLLEKYIKVYPSCLELVLMAARVENHFGSLSFDGFEEVLRNWPDDSPGLQCIWNQYAECALQTGKFDFVKELMERWFCHVRKAPNLHAEGFQANSSEDSNTVLQSASTSDLCAWFSRYNLTDRVYGMLNLSLQKVLQNDHTNALYALNQALKAASADNYCHCLRELTMFLLTNNIIQQDKEANISHILSMVKVHMADGRAWVAAEPLSRRFMQKIGRPRVRHLVSKMLRPVSADFSLMNMVVEIWHRVLWLPQMHNNITNFVDYVEGMMEIMPSNYLLATSVCNLLIKNSTLKDSISTCFWASSLLVNALYYAVPVAPEYIWVESAEVLFNLTNSRKIGQSFHKKALSVYPFSIELWKSYLRIFDGAEFGDSIRAAAKEKGIVLD